MRSSVRTGENQRHARSEVHGRAHYRDSEQAENGLPSFPDHQPRGTGHIQWPATRRYDSSMNNVARLYVSLQPPIDFGRVCLNQRHSVVSSTDRPHSAMSSSMSRRLSAKRRYWRKPVTNERQHRTDSLRKTRTHCITLSGHRPRSCTPPGDEFTRGKTIQPIAAAQLTDLSHASRICGVRSISTGPVVVTSFGFGERSSAIGWPIKSARSVCRRASAALTEPAPTCDRRSDRSHGWLRHDHWTDVRIAQQTGLSRQSVGQIGWEYVHIAIDDHSRIAFSAIFPDEKQNSAVAFLDAAIACYARREIRFPAVLTDNGSALSIGDIRP